MPGPFRGCIISIASCVILLFFPACNLAQGYKEIDRVGDELARQCMKAKIAEVKIAVADLHDTHGTAGDQGHYFSLILTSAINLHMKHHFAVLDHAAFDSALAARGIPRSSLTAPGSLVQIAEKIDAAIVVMGEFQHENAYYSLHLSTVRVTDGTTLGTAEARFVGNEFLDSLAKPFRPSEIGYLISLKTERDAANHGVHPPTCASCPVPAYTAMARDRHIQGVVIFDAIISERGELVALRPVTVLGLGLDESAYNAMTESWRMKPATDKDGKPIPVEVPVEFTFRLR
jgi:Gram-negative bacterial TonB protein C-terminal